MMRCLCRGTMGEYFVFILLCQCISSTWTYATISSHTSLMPLFHEQAYAAGMIMHATCMKVIKDAVEHGQTPIITMLQPMCAQDCKTDSVGISWHVQICWHDGRVAHWNGSFENALKVVGRQLVDISLSSSKHICFRGKAEVTRTRYVHHVAAAALYALQKDAYQAYANSDHATEVMSHYIFNYGMTNRHCYTHSSNSGA